MSGKKVVVGEPLKEMVARHNAEYLAKKSLVSFATIRLERYEWGRRDGISPQAIDRAFTEALRRLDLESMSGAGVDAPSVRQFKEAIERHVESEARHRGEGA